jgi:pyruvate formate lyase activating enzyme
MVAPKGLVFDIQRSSLHDGPGLRTTVFLKGCPLKCAWCHNPESKSPHPQKGLSSKVYGEWMDVESVMASVLADREYYETSGGGMTLSGGEATQQYDFCKILLKAAKDEGIHTCLDTCGQVNSHKLEALIPLVDLFHYDYKIASGSEHKHWTGSDGTLIQQNLNMLVDKGCAIILRCPIIPGVNDTIAHRKSLDLFRESPQFLGVEELPYHRTGEEKYRDLGMEIPDF